MAYPSIDAHSLPEFHGNGQFSRVVQEIVDAGPIFDARNHARHWKIKWVVFCDLQAFGSRSMLSTSVPLNNLVRFHHALKAASDHCEPDSRFDFTDACYATFNTLKDALRFATRVHQVCLAHNSVYEVQGGFSAFAKMVVPTTGIARGKTLFLRPIDSGGHGSPLMLGDGIVQAHAVQSRAIMGTIAIRASHKQALRHLPIGQNTKLEAWRDSLLSGPQDDAWHMQRCLENETGDWVFPYPLASAGQSNSERLVAATLEEGRNSMQAIARLCRSWFEEFGAAANQYQPPTKVARHGLGLARWTLALFDATTRTKSRSADRWKRFVEQGELTIN